MIGVGVHEQQGSLVVDQGSNAGNSAFGPVPGTILAVFARDLNRFLI